MEGQTKYNDKKKKKNKRQAMIDKKLQKTKDWATRTLLTTGVNSGAPERYADPGSLVEPVVLLLFKIRW